MYGTAGTQTHNTDCSFTAINCVKIKDNVIKWVSVLGPESKTKA